MSSKENKDTTFDDITHTPKEFKSTTHYSNSTAREDQNVASSSFDAWEAIRDTSSYTSREMQSLAALKALGGEASRKMLSKLTGLENSSMTQFCKGLLEKNLIHELPVKRACLITGRNVYYLKVGPKPVELVVTKSPDSSLTKNCK